MKTIALAILLCLQDVPIVNYERGQVSPVSRAVANRPMAQPETSKQLTQQQLQEIRIASLECEVLELQARLATKRKADLIQDAKKVLGVDESWHFNIETMRFEAPKEKP